MVEQDGVHVLQWLAVDGWTDLQAFVPETRPTIDFVVVNHYASSHPNSIFVQTLMAQLAPPTVR